MAHFAQRRGGELIDVRIVLDEQDAQPLEGHRLPARPRFDHPFRRCPGKINRKDRALAGSAVDQYLATALLDETEHYERPERLPKGT